MKACWSSRRMDSFDAIQVSGRRSRRALDGTIKTRSSFVLSPLEATRRGAKSAMERQKDENHLRLRFDAGRGARILRPAGRAADASEGHGGGRKAHLGATRRPLAGIGPAHMDGLRARSVPNNVQ